MLLNEQIKNNKIKEETIKINIKYVQEYIITMITTTKCEQQQIIDFIFTLMEKYRIEEREMKVNIDYCKIMIILSNLFNEIIDQIEETTVWRSIFNLMNSTSDIRLLIGLDCLHLLFENKNNYSKIITNNITGIINRIYNCISVYMTNNVELINKSMTILIKIIPYLNSNNIESILQAITNINNKTIIITVNTFHNIHKFMTILLRDKSFEATKYAHTYLTIVRGLLYQLTCIIASSNESQESIIICSKNLSRLFEDISNSNHYHFKIYFVYLILDFVLFLENSIIPPYVLATLQTGIFIILSKCSLKEYPFIIHLYMFYLHFS